MIPKKIHYCWFGRNPLPETARKCIASWRKFLPDYEIIEWNEDNFDVYQTRYTAEAYQAKKFAFVSDYARFKILYENGGLYFDTDVEIIKPMDDIIGKGAFMGFEIDPCKNYPYGAVNPGVGIGAESHLEVYKRILDYYSAIHFIDESGKFNQTTIVTYTTQILKGYGLQTKQGIQNVEQIRIYPVEYFNPFNDLTGQLNITPNTRSIHWYSKSWLKVSPFRQFISRLSHRTIGIELSSKIRKLLNL